MRLLCADGRVALVFVDEAHTVFLWGTGGPLGEPAFRPALLNVGELLRRLASEAADLACRRGAPAAAEAAERPPTVLASGTLSPTALAKVQRAYNLSSSDAVVVTSLRKTNVRLEVFPVHLAAMSGALHAEFEHGKEVMTKARYVYPAGGKVLLFCQTKAQLRELCVKFADAIQGDSALGGDSIWARVKLCAHYSGIERTSTCDNGCVMHILDEDAFAHPCEMHSLVLALVTDTMSHGVDAPDVVAVCQFGPPAAVEVYDQRNGRTGRNAERVHLGGVSSLVLHPDQLDVAIGFARNSPGGIVQLRSVLDFAYFACACRHVCVLRRLGDAMPGPYVEPHRCCDNCTQWHAAVIAGHGRCLPPRTAPHVVLNVASSVLELLECLPETSPNSKLQPPTLKQCWQAAVAQLAGRCTRDWIWLLLVFCLVHEYVAVADSLHVQKDREETQPLSRDHHNRFVVDSARKERLEALRCLCAADAEMAVVKRE